MTVTTSGVQGYEFQYKITLFLTLQILKQTHDLEVFVEPLDGEDIVFKTSSQTYNLEVQVKSEGNTVDENKLSEWLCHFEPYSSSKCLLTRLMNSDVSVLFVTKSRCSDNTAFLRKKESNVVTSPLSNFTQAVRTIFHKVLKNAKFYKNTSLGKKRNTFINQLSNSYTKKDVFNSVFNKIKIWDECSEEILDLDILRILNSEYQIAQSKTADIYLILLELVREARDNKNNLIPSIQSAVNRYRINTPNLSGDYFDRGFESELFKLLEKQSVLLLTGISLCGKTEISKQLAFQFINKGFNYSITSDFLSAESFFFSTNPSEDKILILEDPFGHLEPIDYSASLSIKLNTLVQNLHVNHKIIITSQKAIIEKLFPKNVGGIFKHGNWIDLTLKENGKAVEYWESISSNKFFSSGLNDNIISAILLNDGEKTLQIGQIRYLSGFEEIEIIDKKPSDLDTIARHNSIDIAREFFANKTDIGNLLAILSFCGDTLSFINSKDLAYVLFGQDISYSIYKGRFPLLEKMVINFKYDKKYKINVEETSRLEYIEERGFIKNNGNNIYFTHPNYFEAGRSVYANFSSPKQLKILKALFRAIACYNEQMSFFSSKQISYLYRETTHSKIKKHLIKKAFKGLNSIFPSTADNCMIFLISIIEELDKNRQNKIINAVARNKIDIYNLQWHENRIPYLIRDSGFLQRKFDILSQEKAEEIYERLGQKEIVSAKEAWDFLNYYRYTNISLNSFVFESLLLYKESFIREKACRKFFKLSSSHFDSKIITKAFNDEHPRVVFNCLRGVFETWGDYNSTAKRLLHPFLIRAISRKDIAIRASDLMTTFGTDYASESIDWKQIAKSKHREIWELWAELFLIFQDNVPITLDIHTPRFAGTMDDAMKFLKIETYLKILNAWYNRINAKIEKKEIPDDHEMSIAYNLLEATKKDSKIREELFAKLINSPSTGFILSSLKWIMSYWEMLSKHEKNKIENLLTSKRADLRWIKAVTITSEKIPSELQLIIFNEKSYLTKKIDFILDNFEPQLLEDSLCVFFGQPQPLWWLALQHRNYDIWDTIVKRILCRKFEVGYEKCLEKFLFDGVNGFGSNSGNNYKLWKVICQNSTDLLLELKTLVYATASCSCNLPSAKKIWNIIIKEYQSRDMEDVLLNIILENIVLLQYHERHHILEIIDIPILEKVLKKTFPDYFLLLTFSKVVNKEIDGSLLEPILGLIDDDENYIKSHVIFKIIERDIEKVELDPSIADRLMNLPNIIYEKGKEIIKPLNSLRQYELDNWLYGNE